MSRDMLVSIVIPVHNGSDYLDGALESVLKQTWKESLEVSIFDDCSNDDTYEKCLKWKVKFESEGIKTVLCKSIDDQPGGVGFAKNKAISQSHGKYICFLDADDIMDENRIAYQLPIAEKDNNCIVGSCYTRIPEGSTKRYTDWSNSLTEKQLYTQVYTSFGPTLINPTWFCSREVFDKIGFFKEIKRGYPEDLDFFYRHLDSGGNLHKIEFPLLTYRYHENAMSFSVHEDTIWDLRIAQIEKNVLAHWDSFTIWNAGKQGRKFYRSLTQSSREKVLALCDVDEKKISKGHYTCELIKGPNGQSPKIPIVHFTKARKPFIICVKLGLSNGKFEENLNSLVLKEGKDFYHFN